MEISSWKNVATFVMVQQTNGDNANLDAFTLFQTNPKKKKNFSIHYKMMPLYTFQRITYFDATIEASY